MSKPFPKGIPITDRIWMDWFVSLINDSAWKVRKGSADPTIASVDNGEWVVWKNTTLNEIRVWVNDGGTMKKSAVFV